MYSLGLPPELLGTGRGLREAKKNKSLKIVEKYFINIKHDLLTAGRFLNKKSVALLVKDMPALSGVLEDIEAIEEYVGEKLGPKTAEEKEHKELVDLILTRLQSGKLTDELLTQAAVVRKSLG
jgi:phosphoenolpyruvate carboxylase